MVESANLNNIQYHIYNLTESNKFQLQNEARKIINEERRDPKRIALRILKEKGNDYQNVIDSIRILDEDLANEVLKEIEETQNKWREDLLRLINDFEENPTQENFKRIDEYIRNNLPHTGNSSIAFNIYKEGNIYVTIKKYGYNNPGNIIDIYVYDKKEDGSVVCLANIRISPNGRYEIKHSEVASCDINEVKNHIFGQINIPF